MTTLPKCRVLWILGVLLIALGAFVHSHADDWSAVPYPPSIDPTGKLMGFNASESRLYVDFGIAMMGLGGIGYTLGLVGWLYPPRTEPSDS